MQIIQEQEYVHKYIMTKQEYEERLKIEFNKGRKDFANDLLNAIKNFPYQLTSWRALDNFTSILVNKIKDEVMKGR